MLSGNCLFSIKVLYICLFSMSLSWKPSSRTIFRGLHRSSFSLSHHHHLRLFSATTNTGASFTTSTSYNDDNDSTKSKVIFVLGGPGAGKGTQCERFAKEFGITHLSAGELLRKEIQTGSTEGQLIDSFLKEGRIVPVEMSLGLLRREIQQLGQHRYLIDGFPRNNDNLHGWLRMMPAVCDIEVVLFLECNEKELERRILERGRTSNRSDDNLHTARKRFTTFQTETLPVVEFFGKQEDHHLIRIDGGRNVDVVYNDLKQSFLPILERDLLKRNIDLIQGTIQNKSIQHLTRKLHSSEKLIAADREILNKLRIGSSKVEDEKIQINGLRGTYTGVVVHDDTKKSFLLTREWTLGNGSWKLALSSCNQ